MDLTTVEAIRQVKYRYLRCVDLKLWDEIGDTFTRDATVNYGAVAYGKPLRVDGRAQIVAFLRTKLGPGILTMHTAGQPEITIAPDGRSATGIWSFQDTVISTGHRIMISGAAFCHDRYELCADSRWRIAHTTYSRVYETMISLDDLPSFKLIAQLKADIADRVASLG